MGPIQQLTIHTTSKIITTRVIMAHGVYPNLNRLMGRLVGLVGRCVVCVVFSASGEVPVVVGVVEV